MEEGFGKEIFAAGTGVSRFPTLWMRFRFNRGLKVRRHEATCAQHWGKSSPRNAGRARIRGPFLWTAWRRAVYVSASHTLRNRPAAWARSHVATGVRTGDAAPNSADHSGVGRPDKKILCIGGADGRGSRPATDAPADLVFCDPDEHVGGHALSRHDRDTRRRHTLRGDRERTALPMPLAVADARPAASVVTVFGDLVPSSHVKPAEGVTVTRPTHRSATLRVRQQESTGAVPPAVNTDARVPVSAKPADPGANGTDALVAITGIDHAAPLTIVRRPTPFGASGEPRPTLQNPSP